MFVKICGLTRVDEAVAAAEAGATAIGFVFASSPRRVSPAQARVIGERLPPGVLRVGVFVSPAPDEVEQTLAEAGLDLAQIHGAFPEEGWLRLGDRAIRGVRVGQDEPHPALTTGRPRFLLLDTYQPGLAGGTGRTFAWSKAGAFRALGLPLLIAGGLAPSNVRAALTATRPAGVDVSSGVESCPGRKDPALVAAFLAAVREWEESFGSKGE
ncbi:MAG: phosphoribosylanthranilate isomerase [Bacillota bacterium]|nr:phosphoribosylanthranilate isomerase [Bacillota bacterium]